MKKVILIILISTIGCNSYNSDSEIEQWKNEILQVEKAFNDMAQRDGLSKAFEYYAAENGEIKRDKKVIKGKSSIGEWYNEDVKPNESLSWKPTYVDVSKSGDMAYTYGDYTFTSQDSLGIVKVSKGIFHTVWKRQKDGLWRFVYD